MSTQFSASDVLKLIEQEIFRLRYSWDTFKLLFATDVSTIKVLNAVGPGFFGMAQRLMWDDIILQVCRITDPAANRSQKNATLRQLLDSTGWNSTDSAKWQIFDNKLRAVETACGDCRKHRNKRISHLDLGWAKQALTLPNAGLTSVGGAVEAIQQFVSDIFTVINPNSSISFETLNGDWEVKHLLRRLLNRTSQHTPNAVVVINYQPDSAAATLDCPFCGSVQEVAFYSRRSPVSLQRIRWHFDHCVGVVGHETIRLRAIDSTGANPPRELTLDLTVPTNKTG